MEQCASWASFNPEETFMKLSQTQMECEGFDDGLTEVWALWWAATMEKEGSLRPPSPTSAPTPAPATLAPPLWPVSAIPTRSLRRCARVKCLLRSVLLVPVSILVDCSSLGLWRYQDPKTPSGVGGEKAKFYGGAAQKKARVAATAAISQSKELSWSVYATSMNAR